LHNILADLTADEVIVASCDGIDPGNSPCLDGWVPHSKGDAKEVGGFAEIACSLASPGDNPNVLNSPAIERPGKVDLAFALPGRIFRLVIRDIQFPAPDEPAISVCGCGDFRGTSGSRQGSVKSQVLKFRD
jgi:hypothetical protein